MFIFTRHIFILAIVLLMGMVVSRDVLAQCSTLADDGSFDCAAFTASDAGSGEGQCTAEEYQQSICKTESGCTYNCVNPAGATGAYQFMDYTRPDHCGASTGLPCVSRAAFANCPALQDAYFDDFNKKNWEYLKTECNAEEVIGTVINGMEITQSCMMAAAHLGGKGGACNYIRSAGSANPDDGATSLSQYCDKHGGQDKGGLEVFTSGDDCDVLPEEEEEDPEIPPVAACGKGPGVAVCDMPACSIGTPTGFCVPVTPTPPPSDDDEDDDEEHDEDEHDEDVCETDGVPYELQGGGAQNGMPTTGTLTCDNLDQICTSPDGVELDIPNKLLQDIISIQGCMQGKGYSAETLYLNSCSRTKEGDFGRGYTEVTDSQHWHGTAMDFSFSGVGTAGIDDLHACANTERDSHGHGGVGQYGSGFPYIHYDIREGTANW